MNEFNFTVIADASCVSFSLLVPIAMTSSQARHLFHKAWGRRRGEVVIGTDTFINEPFKAHNNTIQ